MTIPYGRVTVLLEGDKTCRATTLPEQQFLCAWGQVNSSHNTHRPKRNAASPHQPCSQNGIARVTCCTSNVPSSGSSGSGLHVPTGNGVLVDEYNEDRDMQLGSHRSTDGKRPSIQHRIQVGQPTESHTTIQVVLHLNGQVNGSGKLCVLVEWVQLPHRKLV